MWTGSEITRRCGGRGAEILYHEEVCYEYTITHHYLRCDELFDGNAMEYLAEDTYGVVDKIDGLNEALGYLLLDESELSNDLVAATKRLREQLKHFQYEFTKAQSHCFSVEMCLHLKPTAFRRWVVHRKGDEHYDDTHKPCS